VSFSHNRPEMNTPEYKAWRFKVFSRDAFKCVMCGKGQSDGVKIEAHHIKRWAESEKARYVVGNGCTLCEDHHLLVTGNEKRYEKELRNLVNKNREQSGLKKRRVNNFYAKERKWRPRNPRVR
jgi:predicted restriction endonuclease